MNHAALGQLPSHITIVRQGSKIWTRHSTADWSVQDRKTISNAKRDVRLIHNCKGGPKSLARTVESLDL